ncbi:MAG: rhomboid family intramembrane serine protease [Luteolibacter sp.]
MTSTGGPFSNVWQNLCLLRQTPVTWMWVVAILGIEALVVAVGGLDQQPAWSWYEWLGLSREGILSGKIWQLVTYGFLHGDWWHTGLNAFFLLLIGSKIEHMAGPLVLVKATFLGILGGGLGHLALAPGAPGSPLLVGLSGGCIGLLILLTTLSPQSRMMPIPVSGRSLGLGILIAELILTLANPALGVPAFSTLGNALVDHGMGGWFKIAHACHLGGGVAGWMLGRWLLRPRVSLTILRRDRERREARDVSRGG